MKKMSEWRKIENEDKDVWIVYSGRKDKVLVKMWFMGNERKYVFEGELRFVGFDGEDDDGK